MPRRGRPKKSFADKIAAFDEERIVVKNRMDEAGTTSLIATCDVCPSPPVWSQEQKKVTQRVQEHVATASHRSSVNARTSQPKLPQMFQSSLGAMEIYQLRFVRSLAESVQAII
jgi:hypothetical protein